MKNLLKYGIVTAFCVAMGSLSACNLTDEGDDNKTHLFFDLYKDSESSKEMVVTPNKKSLVWSGTLKWERITWGDRAPKIPEKVTLDDNRNSNYEYISNKVDDKYSLSLEQKRLSDSTMDIKIFMTVDETICFWGGNMNFLVRSGDNSGQETFNFVVKNESCGDSLGIKSNSFKLTGAETDIAGLIDFNRMEIFRSDKVGLSSLHEMDLKVAYSDNRSSLILYPLKYDIADWEKLYEVRDPIVLGEGESIDYYKTHSFRVTETDDATVKSSRTKWSELQNDVWEEPIREYVELKDSGYLFLDLDSKDVLLEYNKADSSVQFIAYTLESGPIFKD